MDQWLVVAVVADAVEVAGEDAIENEQIIT